MRVSIQDDQNIEATTPVHKPLTVVFVDPFGYVQPYLRELSGGMSKSGARPEIVRLDFIERRSSGQKIRRYLPSITFNPTQKYGRIVRRIIILYNLVLYFAALVELYRRVNSYRPDIVHFQWITVPVIDLLFVRLLRRRYACVLTVHDSIAGNGESLSALERVARKRLMNLFDGFVVHTREAGTRVSQLVSSGKPIVEVEHGLLSRSSLYRFPPEIVFEEDKIYFLMLGNIKIYKGLDVLVKSVSRFIDPAQREKFRFVVAGRPNFDLTPVKNYLISNGASHLFQFCLRHLHEEEMTALLLKTNIVVFPYRKIDASGVLMLSLQFGKPILASNIGYFSEILVDGVHGFLVEPDNPAALGKKISEIAVLAGSGGQMAQNVSHLGTRISTWSQIADLTINLLYKKTKK